MSNYREFNEKVHYQAIQHESKFWSLALTLKYATAPTKYIMASEEEARKAFTELTELVTKERAYDINDKKYVYTFESERGGAISVDLREVSLINLNPPYEYLLNSPYEYLLNGDF